MGVWGGIEAGGTKFVCAIGTGPDDIRAEETFPTTTPQESIGRAVEFFARRTAAERVEAIGIASFGPIDPNPCSSGFGFITTTPKAGWAHTDFAGAVRRGLRVPVGFDTDVNVAALGEHRWGAAAGLDHFIYLTIGTGIGGGGLANGRLLHGLVHPEMGHLRIPRHPDDSYSGWCPYHQDCLEGLANGPAIEARWGRRAEQLGTNHPAWALEAYYLACGLVNFICTLSPQRIIMGGGVMHQAQLFPLIRSEVQRLLGGYVQHPDIAEGIDRYIVPPGLGDRAGVLGAIALAEQTASKR